MPTGAGTPGVSPPASTTWVKPASLGRWRGKGILPARGTPGGRSSAEPSLAADCSWEATVSAGGAFDPELAGVGIAGLGHAGDGAGATLATATLGGAAVVAGRLRVAANGGGGTAADMVGAAGVDIAGAALGGGAADGAAAAACWAAAGGGAGAPDVWDAACGVSGGFLMSSKGPRASVAVDALLV
jgi:hypothetical protein